jgi:hypothetical protein
MDKQLFRKKPVVIEAAIYEFGMEDGFVVDGRYYDKSGPVPRSMKRIPAIKTLEGRHEISPGDWIITGVKGERYPCKPDIFAMTYEPARLESPEGEGAVAFGHVFRVVGTPEHRNRPWDDSRHGVVFRLGAAPDDDGGIIQYRNLYTHPAAPEDGWRPIAEAPTDGRRLLLALVGGAVVIGKWTEDDAKQPCLPTHFRHLPPAPTPAPEQP